MRAILLESPMDPSFIVSKARDEGLFIQNLDQQGLEIHLQLSSQGDDNAIRRFKNKIRMKNPRIERIEVRQPERDAAAPKPKKQIHYDEWRKKTITQLKRIASQFGWDLYTDPVAGQNTDYLLMMRGRGSDREVIKVRVSEHPTSQEVSDVSIDMIGQEASVSDLRSRLKREVRPRDDYPLI
jgi:hypothetical protein